MWYISGSESTLAFTKVKEMQVEQDRQRFLIFLLARPENVTK